jgi:hypothetical protein
MTEATSRSGTYLGVSCAATADGHNSLAMLARRDGETLTALLRRLGRALGRYCDDGAVVDEVNGGLTALSIRRAWTLTLD